ncbi:MAG: hypothetical protein LC118_21550 [Dehalococcoidia bacterium]|nr:hypothetical protein [Dehalococcoidia bacterium]
MSWMKRKSFGMVAATLACAAILGGTLGVAFARNTDLGTGFQLVGGPVNADVQAKDWVSCLPSTSWASIYIWDAPNQKWLHYFNTKVNNVPNYVNDQSLGGISNIPRFAGVAIIMQTAVSQAKFPDSPSQACAP